MKNLKLSRPQGQIIDIKWKKSQSIRYFEFFSLIIELVRELVFSNMHNLERIHEQLQVTAPTSKL